MTFEIKNFEIIDKPYMYPLIESIIYIYNKICNIFTEYINFKHFL